VLYSYRIVSRFVGGEVFWFFVCLFVCWDPRTRFFRKKIVKNHNYQSIIANASNVNADKEQLMMNTVNEMSSIATTYDNDKQDIR